MNEKVHRCLIRAIVEFSENIEVYLYFMKKMINYLSISNSSYLMSILLQLIRFKDQNDCKMLKVVNPLKICILISELLDLIKFNSTQLKTECKDLKNKFLKLASALIDEPKEKGAVELALKDKDLEGREVLDLICSLDYYEVLNNNVVEQMSLKIWNGPHSTQGNFYDTSTFFQIVSNVQSVHELRVSVHNIFNRTPDKIKTLVESYVSWKDCVKVKYYNYIALFFLFNLFFQIANNLFIISFRSKIGTAQVLLSTVRVFVPKFNSLYNTTLDLNMILGNATSNTTFQYVYIAKLPPDDYKTFSNII